MLACAHSLVSSVSAWGQQAIPRSGLPLQERMEQEQVQALQNLLTFLNADKSILLARVVQVDRQPPEVYRRLRNLYPMAAYLNRAVPVLGGRLQAIETLSGSPGPAEIAVDNRDYLKRLSSRFEASSKRPLFLHMYPGQFWIVVCDKNASGINRQVTSGTVALAGVDDPLLSLYRRHAAWMAQQNVGQALLEMRTMLLNPKENPLSRLAALYSLVNTMLRKNADFGKSPDYPFMRHALAELLAQPNVPRYLLVSAIRSIYIDPRREIVGGSEEAALLHYLLDLVEKGTDNALVDLAADKLQHIASQSDDQPPYTFYYIPEILEALERREREDRARRPVESEGLHPSGFRSSPVARSLSNLRFRLKLNEGHPIVVRGIPARAAR